MNVQETVGVDKGTSIDEDQFLIILTESEKKVVGMLGILLELANQIQAHSLSKKEFKNNFSKIKLQFKELSEINSEGADQIKQFIELFGSIKKTSTLEYFEDISLEILSNQDHLEIVAKLETIEQDEEDESQVVETEEARKEIVLNKPRKNEEKYLLCLSTIPWIVMLLFFTIVTSNLDSIEKKFS